MTRKESNSFNQISKYSQKQNLSKDKDNCNAGKHNIIPRNEKVFVTGVESIVL